MLRVVVYINQIPLVDALAVRMWPARVKEGTMCTYRIEGGKRIKQRFDWKNGAAKLAIKLLKETIGRKKCHR